VSDLNQGYSATANPGTGAQLDCRSGKPAGDAMRTHPKHHQDLHAQSVAPLRDPIADHSASDASGTYPGNGGL